jgi:hypothetical protein
MGAGRLIAATAPSFVLVHRLARCIGQHPVPTVSVLATPCNRLVRYGVSPDPGP